MMNNNKNRNKTTSVQKSKRGSVSNNTTVNWEDSELHNRLVQHRLQADKQEPIKMSIKVCIITTLYF